MSTSSKQSRWGALLFLLPTLVFGQKYNIYSKELPNGLDVIVIENPVVPLVTIEMDVRNGSYTEPPEYNGLSHLYEHMFFKANASIPNQEKYLERARELGMSWNGTTSEERVNYFFTFGKDSLRAGLEFMRAAIMTPLFLEEELVKERPVVTGEYDRGEANPFFHLFRENSRKLWYEHYSRKNVIGDRQVILTADQKKMRTIQERYYIPNNSALLVAGDVEHNQIFKLAEEYFGTWKSGPDPFTLYPIPMHPPLKRSETVMVEKPVNAVTIQINMHGPSVSKDPKATFAADVLSYILTQRNSKFQKRLVETGLCSFAAINYYTLDHTGPITIQAQTSPEKYLEAEKAIFEELQKLTDPDYYTDDQVDNAKEQLELNEMYGQERPSTFVHTVGFWWSVTGSLEYYLNYIDNLRKINRADINEYVKKYIQNTPYVKGILLSPEMKKKLFPQ